MRVKCHACSWPHAPCPFSPPLPLPPRRLSGAAVRQQKTEQERQQAEEEARLRREEGLKPTIAGRKKFNVFVKTLVSVGRWMGDGGWKVSAAAMPGFWFAAGSAVKLEHQGHSASMLDRWVN